MVWGKHFDKNLGHSNTQAGHPAGSGTLGGWVSKTPELFVQTQPSGCGQAVKILHAGQSGTKVDS